MGWIYKVENKLNGDVYIGKTVGSLDARRAKHKYSASKGSNTHFHNALRKYGWKAFEWSALEEVPGNLAGFIEQGWIGLYKVMGIRLYNETIGGDGAAGYTHKPEIIARIAAKNKGKHWTLSDETRQRQSEAAQRRSSDPAYIERLRASSKARDPKYKDLISAAMKNRKPADITVLRSIETRQKTYIGFISPNGEPITIVNMNQFCKANNLFPAGMRALMRGEVNHYKGWTYAEP